MCRIEDGPRSYPGTSARPHPQIQANREVFPDFPSRRREGSESKGERIPRRPLMLELVTTGGQTGADQAGWRAAKLLGLATGGWMPMGFRTEGRLDDEGMPGPDESHPEFAELYGARAHESLEYRVRTRANVGEAD